MSPAERRANATAEIHFLCKRIAGRAADGPGRHEPTTEDDATRYEAIVAALETALAAAIIMNNGGRPG